MPKQKRSALIKFLASVLAVVIGTAVLGSLTAGQAVGGEGMEGHFDRGQLKAGQLPGAQTQQTGQSAAPATGQ